MINRRPERERGSVISRAHQTLTWLVATVRLLSALLTPFIFVTWSCLSVNLASWERSAFFFLSYLWLKWKVCTYHSLGRKASLQRLFSLVWLQKPKERDQTCPQPLQGSLATAWFFQMGRLNCPVYPARPFPCRGSTECFTFLEWNWYHCWIVLLKFQDYTACF